MRRLALLLALLFSAVPAFAQSTTVAGTITDAGAQAWAFGTVQFTFRPSNSNPTGQYFWNGAPFDKSTTIPATPLPLDGSGSFAGVSVPSNNFINPSGSTWTVQVCPAATTPCFSRSLTITGGTLNISAQIIPPPVNLNLTNPFLGARAYTDSEVTGAQPGAIYFNVTDNRIHVCLLTGFPPCTWFVLNGGSGTVTSVSGLSPLFTTTNPTTTPTFVLSNAPATTVFGNPTGSPAPPGYFPLSSFGGIVNSVTGTTNQITASPTTGNVVLSFGVTEIMPGTLETNDTITTDNGDLVTTNGRVLAGGLITAGGSIQGGANQFLGWTGRGKLFSDTSGNVTLRNNANSADTGLTANTVTVDSLTSGRCVQAGALGILTTTANPCPNISATQIATATLSPGCTTGSSTQDNCPDTLTWSGTFADAAYLAICWGIDSGAGGPAGGVDSIILIGANVQTTTTIQVITQTLRGRASAFQTINCIGINP